MEHMHMTMDMDMPGHDMSGHTNMTMPAMCKMNMIFNWDPTDVCVVFKWWHIRGTGTFILSFLAIATLGIAYEYLRKVASSPLLAAEPRRIVLQDSSDDEEVADDSANGSSSRAAAARRRLYKNYGAIGAVQVESREFIRRNSRAVRAVMYGVQVVFSFFIMLVAMTYNGPIIMAVGLGAIIGNYIFTSTSSAEDAEIKSLSCH
ncbi:Ctr copper transporter family-domain-containing protein [Limtongia smithiae]|uniref:Ctr copper transporter family-domain-containing protein n=1 Tax=Limtongia smithiae TaxID=1125753 RepID=UPI0034CF38B5